MAVPLSPPPLDHTELTTAIIVPLDGSEVAERALAPARWFALGFGAELQLVMSTFEAEPSAEAAYLANQAAGIDAPHVTSRLLRHTFPVRGISDLVDERPHAAVCMTTHGRGAVFELLLGSVSEEVLSVVAAPVVLVGPRCRPWSPAPPSRDLVLGVGGSGGSDALLPVVCAWAKHLDLAVQVVHCDPSTTRSGDVPLDASVTALTSAGIRATGHLLKGADPSAALVAFANGRDAALLAIGTHEHAGLTTALGSVARHAVRHSACPVLVRRPTRQL